MSLRGGARPNTGGARPGAGRKPKATEIELIQRLSPFDDVALKELEKGVKSGDYNFIKLFMEYRFGKPKQQTDIELKGSIDTTVQALKPIIAGEEGE